MVMGMMVVVVVIVVTVVTVVAVVVMVVRLHLFFFLENRRFLFVWCQST